MASNQFSKPKRLRIYERDKYVCWYCGKQLVSDPSIVSLKEMTIPQLMLLPTIDHLVPRVRGGYDTENNLVTACRMCNSQKGRKTVEEYRAYLACDLENANDVAAWVRGATVSITFWGENETQIEADAA